MNQLLYIFFFLFFILLIILLFIYFNLFIDYISVFTCDLMEHSWVLILWVYLLSFSIQFNLVLFRLMLCHYYISDILAFSGRNN